MAEGPSWGVPPNMPPPPPTHTPPPPPAAMPPPVPGTGASAHHARIASAPAHYVAPPVAFMRSDKSVGVTYLLWLFLGFLGIHHFYLGKWQRGLWYLFTFGLLFIGLFVDLFTLPWQVKRVNAERRAGLR